MTYDQRLTTNDQRPMTNDQRPTTNDHLAGTSVALQSVRVRGGSCNSLISWGPPFCRLHVLHGGRRWAMQIPRSSAVAAGRQVRPGDLVLVRRARWRIVD